jgi:c-di-GMP-binding flagellar brake protein YcgR
MADKSLYAINVLNSSQKENFLVNSKFERMKILRELHESRIPVTAYLNNLTDSYITIILDVDKESETITFDSARDAAFNKVIFKGKQLSCATLVDNIKVEFLINNPSWLKNEKHGVMTCPLPQTMVRLQRRQFFRVPVAVDENVQCHIDHKGTEMSFHLYDISCGGIGTRQIDRAFTPGTIIKNCLIELPGVAQPVKVDVEVRVSSEITLDNGKKLRHTGLAFVNLEQSQEILIQRYIFTVERVLAQKGL